jgi:hypothetical protein
MSNLCFASGRICGSHSALRCIRGMKIDTLFFILMWDRYGFHKKSVGTPYAELVLLYPVVSTGHVVHSSASEARNVDAIFFTLV